MRNTKPSAFLLLCLVVASVVAAPSMSAQPDAAAEPVEELDEIVVRGKRLAQEIEEAEDKFFKLFNEVNKDHRYDTHCVSVRLPDSRIETRTCIPAFVANAMEEWAPYRARCQPPLEDVDEFSCLDRNNDRSLSWEEAGARPELEGAFSEMDENDDNRLSYDEFLRDTPGPTAVYMPPPPDLVLMNGTQAWYDHMMKVTSSDPRLKQMADHLGGLYYELRSAQSRYDEVVEQTRGKPAKPNLGPRRP